MVYHILNGDALKDYFPSSLEGTILVARECLVYGNVKASDLEVFWQTRADQLNPLSDLDYHEAVVPQFQQIISLQATDTAYLWFEKDLFCQVNFWFCCYLIQTFSQLQKVYLVLPSEKAGWKGFGGMNTIDLAQVFEDKICLSKESIHTFSALWLAFQNQDLPTMQTLADTQNEHFPFLKEVVEAHIARFPKNGSLGHPEQILLSIITRLESPTFGNVFKVFCQEAGIYGFGDLYVKELYDKLIVN